MSLVEYFKPPQLEIGRHVLPVCQYASMKVCKYNLQVHTLLTAISSNYEMFEGLFVYVFLCVCSCNCVCVCELVSVFEGLVYCLFVWMCVWMCVFVGLCVFEGLFL